MHTQSDRLRLVIIAGEGGFVNIQNRQFLSEKFVKLPIGRKSGRFFGGILSQMPIFETVRKKWQKQFKKGLTNRKRRGIIPTQNEVEHSVFSPCHQRVRRVDMVHASRACFVSYGVFLRAIFYYTG